MKEIEEHYNNSVRRLYAVPRPCTCGSHIHAAAQNAFTLPYETFLEVYSTFMHYREERHGLEAHDLSCEVLDRLTKFAATQGCSLCSCDCHKFTWKLDPHGDAGVMSDLRLETGVVSLMCSSYQTARTYVVTGKDAFTIAKWSNVVSGKLETLEAPGEKLWKSIQNAMFMGTESHFDPLRAGQREDWKLIRVVNMLAAGEPVEHNLLVHRDGLYDAVVACLDITASREFANLMNRTAAKEVHTYLFMAKESHTKDRERLNYLDYLAYTRLRFLSAGVPTLSEVLSLHGDHEIRRSFQDKVKNFVDTAVRSSSSTRICRLLDSVDRIQASVQDRRVSTLERDVQCLPIVDHVYTGLGFSHIASAIKHDTEHMSQMTSVVCHNDGKVCLQLILQTAFPTPAKRDYASITC